MSSALQAVRVRRERPALQGYQDDLVRQEPRGPQVYQGRRDSLDKRETQACQDCRDNQADQDSQEGKVQPLVFHVQPLQIRFHNFFFFSVANCLSAGPSIGQPINMVACASALGSTFFA